MVYQPTLSKEEPSNNATRQPPQWAQAYWQHVSRNKSDNQASQVSPKGMHMMWETDEIHGRSLAMATLPTLSPSSTGSPAADQDLPETPRCEQTGAVVPFIVVQCDDKSERSVILDSILPVGPVSVTQKTVVDYLNVPIPQWLEPDDDEDQDDEDHGWVGKYVVDGEVLDVESHLNYAMSGGEKVSALYGVCAGWNDSLDKVA